MLTFGFSKLVLSAFELILDFLFDFVQLGVDHLLDSAHNLLLHFLLRDIDAHTEHLK